MNYWELLGISKTQDKALILEGLIQKIERLDFKNDLAEIFQNIKTYHQLLASLERKILDEAKLFPVKVGFSNEEIILPYLEEEIYETPEQLIAYFTEIYGNLATRFNILYWKSAIANAKIHSSVDPQDYCLPIVDFLSTHLFVKSDVLQELAKTFPLLPFFESEEWDSLRSTKVNYGYVEFLINCGNFELDLQIDALLEHNYTSEQIEAILGALTRSILQARKKDFPGAFDSLASAIPEEAKPLLVKQREANLLFAAVVQEKHEEARGHLINVLNQSLQRFPGDAHLLYIRASYLFHTLDQDEALREIIDTLKVDPTNTKCFFLLGKIYLKKGLNKEAYEVFQGISGFEPLNVEYAAYGAIAIQEILKDQMQLQVQNKSSYIEQAFQLIDLSLFEEVGPAPDGLQNDPDIRALQLFVRVCELNYYHDTRN